MQKPETRIPPYKPPAEFQELIQQRPQQQQFPQQRKRTAVLPKRNWIQRNPRVFQITFITTSLLIFFSKPIYDAFIADPLPTPQSGPVPASKR